MRSIEVWDLPTRVFHWALAVFVIFDLTVAEDEGLELVLHTYAGYLVLLLLVFRLAWGLVGGEHARFADFLVGWRGVRAYAGRLVGREPVPHVAGHNPLGGWMIVLMMATLVVIVVTGLMTQGEHGGAGPLTGLVGRGAQEAAEEIHEGAADFMIALIVIHILGVLASSVLHGENLTRAMVTGRKTVEEDSGLRDARPVPAWRALALVLLLAAGGWWLVAKTSFPGPEAEAHEDYDDDAAYEEDD